MTALQAYQLFLLKINKNDSNANVHISKAEFVKIYNEEQRRWLNEKLGAKLDSDEVNDLNELLVPFIELTQSGKTGFYLDYELPSDFFAAGAYYIIATKGNCKKVVEPSWVNMKNINVLLADEFNKPSFDYERILLTFSANRIQAYTGDFGIHKFLVSYYKMPPDIDIEGYINEDGTSSIDIDPVLQDMWIEQIINRCARAVIANYENPDGFQLREAIIKTEE